MVQDFSIRANLGIFNSTRNFHSDYSQTVSLLMYP